jgi:hypothetical protein
MKNNPKIQDMSNTILNILSNTEKIENGMQKVYSNMLINPHGSIFENTHLKIMPDSTNSDAMLADIKDFMHTKVNHNPQYVPFTLDPNAPQNIPPTALIINQNANPNSTPTTQIFDANGHTISVNIGNTTNNNDQILLDSSLTPQGNTATFFNNQGLPPQDQSPSYINRTIIMPENNSEVMITSNIIVLPCDNKRPFIWLANPDRSLEALNNTLCDTNQINIVPAQNPTTKQLWEVQSSGANDNTEYVAYLLFEDFLFKTSCPITGICPEDKIFNSLFKPDWVRVNYGTDRPDWVRVNYGTDRHGIYYEDKNHDLSIGHLDEMQMIEDGAVIKKVEFIGKDHHKYTLVRLESNGRPIIFNENSYDTSGPEYVLINSKQINLTPEQHSGPNSHEQALYMVNKIVSHANHTISATLTPEFVFSNFYDNDSVRFSFTHLLEI